MTLIRLAWSYLTWGVIIQSGLERGFRYFKVSPIKAFRDIRHVSVDKIFATGRYTTFVVVGNHDVLKRTASGTSRL